MGNHKNYSSKQVDGKYINYYYQIACDNKLTSDARTIIQRIIGSNENYIIKQPTLIVEYGWSDNAMTTALNVLKANNYLYIDDNDFYHFSSSGNLKEEAKATGVTIPVFVPSPSVKERLEHLEKQKENNRKGYDKKRKAKMKKKHSITLLVTANEITKPETPEVISSIPTVELNAKLEEKKKASIPVPVQPVEAIAKDIDDFKRCLNGFAFHNVGITRDEREVVKEWVVNAYMNHPDELNQNVVFSFISQSIRTYKQTFKSS